jgi:hypothetical protein
VPTRGGAVGARLLHLCCRHRHRSPGGADAVGGGFLWALGRMADVGSSLDYSYQLSVRKVVRTLTSEMRQDRSLDGRCKATREREFILVPAAGPYVQ